VLKQNTVSAIEQLSAQGFLAQADTTDLLGAAHLQLALLQALRIASPGPFEAASASEGMKGLLTRAGGAEDFSALEANLVDSQIRARAVFEGLFAG
jgi:hypothetical protein